MDWGPPGSCVHGILRARVLEWVVMPSSRSSQPRDRARVSCIAGRFFSIWAIAEARQYLLSVHGVFVQKCPAALPTPEQMAPAQTLLRLQRLGRERTGSVSQYCTWELGLRGDTITSDHPLVSLPDVILMHVMDFTPRIRFHHRTAQLTAGFPGCTMLKYPPASLVDVG